MDIAADMPVLHIVVALLAAGSLELEDILVVPSALDLDREQSAEGILERPSASAMDPQERLAAVPIAVLHMVAVPTVD